MALLQLPRDVLNEIFSYLNERCDIWRIERVCRSFKTISRRRTVWRTVPWDTFFPPEFIVNYPELTVFDGYIIYGTPDLYKSKLKKFKVGGRVILECSNMIGFDDFVHHIRAFKDHPKDEVKLYGVINELEMIIKSTSITIPRMTGHFFFLPGEIRKSLGDKIEIHVEIDLKQLTASIEESHNMLIGQHINSLTIRISSKKELDKNDRLALLIDIISQLSIDRVIIQSIDTDVIKILNEANLDKLYTIQQLKKEMTWETIPNPVVYPSEGFMKCYMDTHEVCQWCWTCISCHMIHHTACKPGIRYCL